MSRSRSLPLLAFALIGVGATAAPAGPAVWRDLDQAALDAAYDQRVWAANLEQVLARQAANSVLVRDTLGAPQRHAYGPGLDEHLDIYATDRPDAPIVVFIHGGAWRAGTARDNAYAAETFVRAGAHFIVPDFSPVQRFDGDLIPMVAQLRLALAWIHRHARDTFGGDPGRIHLVGFSSGAHLASVLLTTDWTAVDTRPASLIKGALLCSGMYDLEPVSLSSRREYVRFTPATIDALSAVRHLARINCPVIVAHGSFESPESQRQAHDFVSALRAAGKPVRLLTAEGYNHFEIIESLANPYGALGRAFLGQMSLSP